MIVSLVSSLYGPHAHGGAERVAQSVAEALAGQGHEVHVISLSKSNRVERTELNGVRVHYVPLRNLYWPFPVSPAGVAMKAAWHAIDAHNPAMARRVGALLDEIRPEVVNTHNLAGFSAAVWPEVARRGLRLVHTLHDYYLLCPYSTMFRREANCASPCLRCRIPTAPRRALSRHVQGVIGVSRFVLERHLEQGLFSRARSSVVYNGYRGPALAAEQTRAVSGKLQIGFLGSLVPAKGLDRLVDAFLDLPPRVAELRIAGSGDPAYEALLKTRSAQRDDLRWLGVVRPEEFLPGLDVLVVPSLFHEPMGRVVVEAFSHGLPVIAARRGGIPELFRGACGWLYEPDDPGGLPAILREILARREVLEPMRMAARGAARRFPLEAMLEGYLLAYREAAARCAGARR
ncbi:MAG: glycosyltransferase family 4 protein [Burkholderiales bacterium]